MKTILVVDDDVSVLRLMADTLAKLGHEVVASATKAAALAHAGRRFDLLVLDINLPNGDGRDLLAVWPLTPRLTVSGLPEADLRKPFTMAELRAAATALLLGPKAD